jgi:hypothetical protein
MARLTYYRPPGESDRHHLQRQLCPASGPCESLCPARVLDAIEGSIGEPLNVWAQAWRALCRENIGRREAAKEVEPGTWIELASKLAFSDGVERSRFQFIGRSSFRAADGVRVQVSNWRSRSYAEILEER